LVWPAWPFSPLTDEIWMMRPQPRSIMSGTTCLVTLNIDVRLVLMTASQSSLVILTNSRSRVMPALLTSTSIGPCSALALAKACTTLSQSATLPTLA
jgi:hypothetical protein